MDPVLQSFFTGVPVFLGHFALTVVLLVIGVAIYITITPHHELRLVREGNAAAAISLGGVVIGMALPLGISMAHSITAFDVLV